MVSSPVLWIVTDSNVMFSSHFVVFLEPEKIEKNGMNGDLVWGGNCIYIYRRANSFRSNTKKSAILMQSKNCKREVTIKDIALFVWVQISKSCPYIRVYDNTEGKKILQCSIFVECKTDLGRNKTTIEQRVTNSTIAIKIWKFVFCRSAYNYLVSCSVITENSKEYSEVFVEWSAHKSFILYAG